MSEEPEHHQATSIQDEAATTTTTTGIIPPEGDVNNNNPNSIITNIINVNNNLINEDLNGMVEERVKVDRKRFEQMLNDNTDYGSDADSFFRKVMKSTNTQIMWPPKLKPGTKSKKDPHVRITGSPHSINAAKEIIFEQLDTRRNRVTLKMDVAFTDHSHIIGKGGRSIQRVMDETGCHIHFPDSNRTNMAEKSNQVSIAGTAIGVEQSRCRIRDMLPISLQFDLPLNNGLHSPPTLDPQSPQLQAIQQNYGITIAFRYDNSNCNNNSYFASSGIITVAVRGTRSHITGLRQGLSVLIEYLTGFSANSINVPLTMTIDVAVQHHSFIMGRSNNNIRAIMQLTGAVITMPDPAVSSGLTTSSLNNNNNNGGQQHSSQFGSQQQQQQTATGSSGHMMLNPMSGSSGYQSSNRKTAIVIRGPNFESVYCAWQELLGHLPLILIFDLKEGQELDAVQVTQLMDQMRQITILIKPKQRQNTKSIVVRGPEKDSRLLFEVRKQILDLDDNEVPLCCDQHAFKLSSKLSSMILPQCPQTQSASVTQNQAPNPMVFQALIAQQLKQMAPGSMLPMLKSLEKRLIVPPDQQQQQQQQSHQNNQHHHQQQGEHISQHQSVSNTTQSHPTSTSSWNNTIILKHQQQQARMQQQKLAELDYEDIRLRAAKAMLAASTSKQSPDKPTIVTTPPGLGFSRSMSETMMSQRSVELNQLETSDDLTFWKQALVASSSNNDIKNSLPDNLNQISLGRRFNQAQNTINNNNNNNNTRRIDLSNNTNNNHQQAMSPSSSSWVADQSDTNAIVTKNNNNYSASTSNISDLAAQSDISGGPGAWCSQMIQQKLDEFDYDEFRLRAAKAMLSKPIDDKPRMPTPFWAGLGFSRSMSESMMTHKLSHLQHQSTLEEDPTKSPNDSSIWKQGSPSSHNDGGNHAYRGPLFTRSNLVDEASRRLSFPENGCCANSKLIGSLTFDQLQALLINNQQQEHQEQQQQQVNLALSQAQQQPSSNNTKNDMNNNDSVSNNNNNNTNININNNSSPNQSGNNKTINDESSYLNLTEFLSRIGLVQYFGLFNQHDIDLGTLFNLTESDLSDLGLPFLHRRKLVIAIAEIKSLIGTDRLNQSTFEAAPGAERNRRNKSYDW